MSNNGALMRIVSMSKKIIKPSSPTPCSLRHHNLSLLDHVATPVNIPVAFFYPNNNKWSYDEITRLVEKSLSKALTYYYPFAGTINSNGGFIECSDVGAEFLNVRATCSMSEILRHDGDNARRDSLIFAEGLPWKDTTTASSAVTVQVTHFESCGGIAISACIPHKIADGHSVFRFMNDWAAIARTQDVLRPPPRFDTCSFLPPATLLDAPAALFNTTTTSTESIAPVLSTKSYHLSSTALSSLKATVAKEFPLHDPIITSVEVATALFYKTAMAAATTISGSFQSSVLNNMVSLRPPVPLNTVGNVCLILVAAEAKQAEAMEVPKLVAQLQGARKQFRHKLTNINYISKELISETLEPCNAAHIQSLSGDFGFYTCSSVRNMGAYTTDFGLGKPTRVILATPLTKNYFLIFDSPTGDGIDVTVTLDERDMSILQTDKRLLQFASLV